LPESEKDMKNEFTGYYLSNELKTVYTIFQNQNIYYSELRLATFPFRINNDRGELPFTASIQFKRNNQNKVIGFVGDFVRAFNITFVKYDNKPSCFTQ
jgi:hypothetical protein